MKKEKREEIELHKKLSSKYANIREKNKNSVYYNEIWLGTILDMIPKCYKYKNVLDYGCGTALFYPKVRKRNKKVNYTGMG
jgi:2-polyprenyl-3-methyl-5-hydroxy-6-metoxy-1,4-benzoquinol methylase